MLEDDEACPGQSSHIFVLFGETSGRGVGNRSVMVIRATGRSLKKVVTGSSLAFPRFERSREFPMFTARLAVPVLSARFPIFYPAFGTNRSRVSVKTCAQFAEGVSRRYKDTKSFQEIGF